MPFALKALAKAGLVIGATVTLIGLLARWFPALDIVNNGLPFLLAFTLIVASLAAFARSGLLTVLALLLTIINCTHFTLALQGGAEEATPGASRFLRVVTFNVWNENDRIDDIAKFLSDTDADLVVMQEMTADKWSKLREKSWLTLSLHNRRRGPRDPFQIQDHREWTRRPRRLQPWNVAHAALGSDRGEWNDREVRRGASGAAVLSQAAICRCADLGGFRAPPDGSLDRRGRFQPDPLDRQAQGLQ